ncbi:hypothetical protein GXW82_00850 [Streptacidiphilus sp. 4-A2]|nr:hypothetical protein [Streptacidiphilus sp. 4-A2]
MFGWYLLSALVAYALCSLAMARQAYGIQRTVLITRSGRSHEGRTYAEQFRSYDQEHALALALLIGLVWPLSLPVYLASHFCKWAITANPPLTRREHRERARAAAERTRELEQALGLAQTGGLALPSSRTTP